MFVFRGVLPPLFIGLFIILLKTEHNPVTQVLGQYDFKFL